MKRNMIRLTLGLAAMCVVVMGLESQADARLFGRGGRGSFGGWGGRNHGCHSHHSGGCEQQTSCCEAPVQQDCGGCQSDCGGCESGCNGHHGRRGLFGRRHHGHHGGGCGGCDSGCGGCNGAVSGGEVIINEGSAAPSPATNGSPAPAAPEAPAENNNNGQQQQQQQQEAPSA